DAPPRRRPPSGGFVDGDRRQPVSRGPVAGSPRFLHFPAGVGASESRLFGRSRARGLAGRRVPDVISQEDREHVSRGAFLPSRSLRGGGLVCSAKTGGLR